MPKKTESEDPLRFFKIHFVAKLQTNRRGTLSWGNFFLVELLVKLFWSVQVVLKNTDENP